MAQLNAQKLVTAIRRRIVDLSLDDCFVRDASLNDACRKIWEGPPDKGGLVSDLWVEAAFPATVVDDGPKTLRELANKQHFHAGLLEQLDRSGAYPKDRLLYAHQSEAIRHSRPDSGALPGLVVTAGTGAGKTECFLLPILNRLFSKPRRHDEGVRCVILYPMNALVNDQVDRLYEWLKGQKLVTLFHFTSETPEDRHAFYKVYSQPWDECRHNTRQQARGWEQLCNGKLIKRNELEERGPVPDVLITNYSMLEYMLCRPQDHVLFGPALEAFVLDEAHLYTGTLAAEITLLMRRVLDRCNRTPNDVLQIATSATLSTGKLRSFASRLFSKHERNIHVIEGQMRRADLDPTPQGMMPSLVDFVSRKWLQTETIVLDDQGAPYLFKESDDERWGELCKDLESVAPAPVVDDAAAAATRIPARLLYSVLRVSPLTHKLEDVLCAKRRMRIGELAKDLWGEDSPDSIRATLNLLRLGASARRQANDYPLISHRLHVLTRAPEGLCVCINSKCTTSHERIAGMGRIVSGYQTQCPDCMSAVLTLFRCGNCGMLALAGKQRGMEFLPLKPSGYSHSLDDTGMPSSARLFSPIPLEDNAAIKKWFLTPRAVPAGPSSGMRLDDFTDLGVCPNCGEEHSRRKITFRPFSPSPALMLSVLTETILAELPQYPSPHRTILPARGRRLLAFTDGRQGAARLGPRLTNQHETQLLRAAIVRKLRTLSGSTALAQSQELEIAFFESQLAQGDIPDEVRHDLAEKLEMAKQKLASLKTGVPVKSIANVLALDPVAAELVDRDGAENHTAPWTAVEWDENVKKIREDLARRVKAELARPLRGSRVGNLESLGLIEVAYPQIETIKVPDGLFAELSAVEQIWSPLLRVLCDNLRLSGHVTLGTESEDDAYDFGGAFIGKFCTREEFIGKESYQRRRSLVLKLLDNWRVNENERDALTGKILGAIWEALSQHAAPANDSASTPGFLPWLQCGTTFGFPGIRINMSSLVLRRPGELYHSARTGHVFACAVPRCVVNGARVYMATEPGCDDLCECTHNEMDADPRLHRRRHELQQDRSSEDVFRIGLWAEEHTAQLSPRENRRLQDLFKAGARNVLSSTTTLELGIDIGGLTSVLMTDVPPGKANYLQRAGRAGRRADGSSLVVTYARQRPFDRNVFMEFGRYLDEPLREPTVLLERRRIATRQAYAFLLGEFFREVYGTDVKTGAMNAFSNIGHFCGVPLPRWWGDEPTRPLAQPGDSDGNRFCERFIHFLEHLAAKPDHTLRRRLVDLLAGCTTMQMVDATSQGISDFILTAGTVLAKTVIEPWMTDYQQLLQAWDSDEARAQKNMSNAICKSCEALYAVTTIEALADSQFLPRYGFPIGVLPLRVYVPVTNKTGYTRIREEDQYRLERPGLLALREYTPGQTIVAGGKAIRSRGLLKHWTGADLPDALGLKGRAVVCKNSHFHYRRDGTVPGNCPVCEQPAHGGIQEMLFPRHGFSTAWWDPPRRTGDGEIVGSVQVATMAFVEKGDDSERLDDFAGIAGLTLRFREGGKMLVYNPGYTTQPGAPAQVGNGFAICTQCGYAEAEEFLACKGRERLSTSFLWHRPLRRVGKSGNARCWSADQAPVLRNQVLGAEQVTDIVFLDFSPWPAIVDLEVAETLSVALRLGGARTLNLDSRELSSMVVPAGLGGSHFGIVVFDNHPGGAGHVLELVKAGVRWFEVTQRDILYVSKEHHARCDSACLSCLLTFDASVLGPDLELRRRDTHHFLAKQLKRPVIDPSHDSPTAKQKAEHEELLDTHKRTTDEVVHSILDACPLGKLPPFTRFQVKNAFGDLCVAELAWPVERIAVLTAAQTGCAHDFASRGWTIVEAEPDPEHCIQSLRQHLNWQVV